MMADLIRESRLNNGVQKVLKYDVGEAAIHLAQQAEYPVFNDEEKEGRFCHALQHAILAATKMMTATEPFVVIAFMLARDGAGNEHVVDVAFSVMTQAMLDIFGEFSPVSKEIGH